MSGMEQVKSRTGTIVIFGIDGSALRYQFTLVRRASRMHRLSNRQLDLVINDVIVAVGEDVEYLKGNLKGAEARKNECVQERRLTVTSTVDVR